MEDHLIDATNAIKDSYNEGYINALNDLQVIISDRLDHEEIRTRWVLFEIDKLREANNVANNGQPPRRKTPSQDPRRDSGIPQRTHGDHGSLLLPDHAAVVVTMEELEHCPFCCGDGNLVEFYDGRNTRFCMECTGCQIQTPRVDNKQEAVDHWNRRDHQACTA